MKIYQIKSSGLLGKIVDVDSIKCIPVGFTSTAPKNLTSEDQVFVWTGSDWVELTDQSEIQNLKQMDEQLCEAERRFEAFSRLRKMRNSILENTDIYMISDYPISAENLDTLKAYRQALRDLPQQEGSPWLDGEIPWPTPPDFVRS